jgi:nucleoside-diphosphate-sugar epimerase
VVSALAGLRNVIIDAQKLLLDAAVSAAVPKFIPSDYSLDFTRFSPGENRNLDWRREFHTYLDKQPIAATTIFNGAFMDMLTGQMPVILFKQKMVLYWGKSDWKWDFTTVENTAQFTAKAAMEDKTPRFLHIAGQQISPKEIKAVVEDLYGKKYRLFRPGGQSLLGFFIKMARTFSPAENELYPAWQGMQYMHNMIDERSKMPKLDNDLYTGMYWTSVKDLLKKHKESL